MYGKIFESMYDGTLRNDWEAMIVFQQLIVLCDQDGIVDMTPEAIHHRTGIPLQIVSDALRRLESPDTSSRTPTSEGRRIERLDAHRDWGWTIVNHRQYRDQRDTADKRRRDRERQAKSRASRGVTPCHSVSHGIAYTDTDTDTDTDTRKKKVRATPLSKNPPTLKEVTDYCTERKNTVDPGRFVDHYTANGWVQSRGKPLVDWRAAVRQWERNEGTFTTTTTKQVKF